MTHPSRLGQTRRQSGGTLKTPSSNVDAVSSVLIRTQHALMPSHGLSPPPNTSPARRRGELDALAVDLIQRASDYRSSPRFRE